MITSDVAQQIRAIVASGTWQSVSEYPNLVSQCKTIRKYLVIARKATTLALPFVSRLNLKL